MDIFGCGLDRGVTEGMLGQNGGTGRRRLLGLHQKSSRTFRLRVLSRTLTLAGEPVVRAPDNGDRAGALR